MTELEAPLYQWVLEAVEDSTDSPPRERFAQAAATLEAALAGREWVLGDRFTVADVICADVLGSARSRGLLGEWRGLQAYVERGEERPALIEAAAVSNQPRGQRPRLWLLLGGERGEWGALRSHVRMSAKPGVAPGGRDDASAQGVPPPRRTSGTMPEAWVYLLYCRDGSLYTGSTVDLERRLARHRCGAASHYTASRLPVELALAIPMSDRTAARREEARIKRLPRLAKLSLVSSTQTPS